MTDIFGAEFIDQIAMMEGPIEPDNWKRYRDDTLDIKANCTLKEHSGYKSNLIDRKFLKVVKKKRSKAIANKEVDLKCASRKYNYVTDF